MESNKKSITKILAGPYIIFSLVSHTDASSWEFVNENSNLLEEQFIDLELNYLFGSGTDDKGNVVPYVFLSLDKVPRELITDIHNWLDDLGQKFFIRSFGVNRNGFGYVMTRDKMYAQVKGINYLDDLPEKNYFVVETGEIFVMDFEAV